MEFQNLSNEIIIERIKFLKPGILKNELDNFQSWKHPGTCPNPDSKFWNRRIQLQAYYYGLCDGRKRINEGP